MSDRPTITQQYAFTVNEDGGIDGGIEPSEESVETSLETFGADVDHRERDSRIDQPEASSFGVDDRPEVTSTDAGEQGALFAQADDNQRTLTGERAGSQCLFKTDEHATGDEHTASDEPAASTSHETTTNRTVAPDGGQRIGGSDEDEDDTSDRSEWSDEDARKW